MEKFTKHFQESVYQTFKDNNNAGGYAKVFEEFDEAEFKKLNKQGCGIYFTPNFFKGGRSIENLVSLNAVYADLDIAKEGDHKERERLKSELKQALVSDRLAPNFIIETKNGLQPLWLIEPSKNIKLYQKVIKGIIEWSKQYGCAGDKVYDVTRVLRMPEYYHMKGEPYLCKVFEAYQEKYTLEELEFAFPYEEKVVESKPKTKLKTGEVVGAIDKIPFQDLMIRAFANVGRRAEFDDKKRLILDGRLTGTHQGKTGDGDFLASNSHEPFEGNRITAVASILACTTKEAFKWIKDEYKLSESVLKEVRHVEAIASVEKKKRGYYSWGSKEITEIFAPIKSSTYGIVGAASGTGKTTFCLNMALANVELGHKVLYLSLEMSTEEIFDYLARKYALITIPEEIYDKIPEWKKTRYDEKIKELREMTALTIKGVKGGTEITWECIVEFLKGEWDLIFIDNFNLIVKPNGLSQHDHEGQMSTRFLSYAEEHQVPLIVVHHFSKGGAISEFKTGYSLSGNAKINNDSQRLVLLERRKNNPNSMENPLTQKQLSELKITIDKGRGYDDGITKILYFWKGRLYDNYPPDTEAVKFWQDSI